MKTRARRAPRGRPPGLEAEVHAFATLLGREGLRLRLDALRFVAHWVTPPGQARRYDTRFYLAAAPAGAPCEPDGTEIVGGEWIAPPAAVAAHERGELPMLRPPSARSTGSCPTPPSAPR